MSKAKIFLEFSDQHSTAEINALALRLNLPLTPLNEQQKESAEQSFLLKFTAERTELCRTGKTSKPICVDFLSPAMRYRTKCGGGRKQLLAKAVGIKGCYAPNVLDATAGFGTDAFILYCLGCKVHMLERSPVISVLLEDGLQRLKSAMQSGSRDDYFLSSLAKDGLTLSSVAALDFMHKVTGEENQRAFDVVYLDPMYPERNTSALNKEKMRILKMIVGDDNDSDELLLCALGFAKKRVVVKRPSGAKYLAGKKPDIEFCGGGRSKGGSCRYDVYVIKS